MFFLCLTPREAWSLNWKEKGTANVDTDLSTFVYTVKKAAARQKSITVVLDREGIPFSFLFGPPIIIDEESLEHSMASLGITGKQVDRYKHVETKKYGALLQMIAQAQYTLKAYEKSSKESSWIFWVEDDLIPESVGSLKGQLEVIMNNYKEYDMIWLSVLNVPSWNVIWRICCGMQGMLYKKSSIRKILNVMVRDAVTGTNLDKILAWSCNAGELKCAVIPIVNESKVKSFADSLPEVKKKE